MAALRAVGLLWRTLGNPAICVRPVALRPLLAESLPCQWVPTRPMPAVVHDVRVPRRDGADRTTVEQRDVSNQGYRCGDDSYRRLRLRSNMVRTPGHQSGTATAVDRDRRSEACRAAGRVSLAVRPTTRCERAASPGDRHHCWHGSFPWSRSDGVGPLVEGRVRDLVISAGGELSRGLSAAC
jgi:hypothetical protein